MLKDSESVDVGLIHGLGQINYTLKYSSLAKIDMQLQVYQKQLSPWIFTSVSFANAAD